MKKTVLCLAALCAATAATAQSSVTMFGVVDATLAYGTADGPGSASRLRLANSGYHQTRLGFRGVEDLGGGMSASFWLEMGLNNDDGTGIGTNVNNQASGGSVAPAGTQGLTFGRRSTVSLAGSWGELRVGRDYSPQIWNLLIFDPLGALGVGMAQPFSAGAATLGPTFARASNSFGYFLPANLGGFYGQAQYYLGENVRNGAATEDDGNGAGVRLGYANGPFDVAVAASRTRLAAGDVHQNNIAAKWQLGSARLLAEVSRDRNGAVRGHGFILGGLYNVGSGDIRAAYSRYGTDAAGSPRADKLALGYVHHLSKRTAVYTTVARLKNHGGSAQTLNAAVAGGPNGSSTGLDLGFRQTF
ncbi:porin [Ramlibacter sp. WS9]|uniref:porin n=1 Tax=Ramlibacter sp. WS9 TaxID=1882741 RepID=UPI001143574A|nr:porin [Ramlibacter sp. WS9]ROZ74982.1 porin [Ramlibacter sp. WS9]